MRLPPLPTISDIVRLYKLSAAKKLSQNFIFDMTLNRRIVRYAGDLKGACVCEVGPGPGGITRAILEQDVDHLYVIEKDRRFFPGLKMLSDATGKLTAYHGDVLRFNMDGLFPEEYKKDWMDIPPNLHIIGNLPFNVATPLIVQYLESISTHSGAWRNGRVKLTLTFQKEVALRMAAPPNDEHRCRLSVDTQNLCEVKVKTIIPGKAFIPPPDVDVGVVHLVPRKKPFIQLPWKLTTKVNRHLFHYRQKMCKNTIATLFPTHMPELVDEMISVTGVSAEKRSFEFSMTEIKNLCFAYHSICERLPYIYDYDYRLPKSQLIVKQMRQLEEETGLKPNNEGLMM